MQIRTLRQCDQTPLRGLAKKRRSERSVSKLGDGHRRNSIIMLTLSKSRVHGLGQNQLPLDVELAKQHVATRAHLVI